MLRAHAKLIRSLLLVLDVLVSALVFVAAVSMPALLTGDPRSSVSLLVPGLMACLAWPLILDQLDLYESQRRRGTGQMLARLALAGSISTGLVAATAGSSTPTGLSSSLRLAAA